MKSLILFNKTPFPVIDGGTMAAHSLAESVINLSESTVLVPFSTAKHPVKSELLPKKWKGKAILEHVEADTSIKPVGFLKSMADGTSYHMQRVRDSKTRHSVLSIMQKHRPDVVIVDGLFGLAYAQIIKTAFDVPVIYRSHNVEHRIWEDLAAKEKNPFKKTTVQILADRLRREEYDMMRFTDGVFFISSADAEWFDQSGFRKPHEVLFPSFEESFFERKFKPSPFLDELRLFHLGAMDWAPNVEAITHFTDKIWPKLREEFGKKISFHAAGRHMPDSLLNKKVDGVYFSESVPDFMTFANAHHLMAVPLISGSGIRMKIAEAMVSGIPVITTTLGIQGIPVEKNKEYLLADNPKDWSKRIGDILSGKIDLNVISQSARERGRALFSPEAAEKTMDKLIDGILTIRS